MNTRCPSLAVSPALCSGEPVHFVVIVNQVSCLFLSAGQHGEVSNSFAFALGRRTAIQCIQISAAP